MRSVLAYVALLLSWSFFSTPAALAESSLLGRAIEVLLLTPTGRVLIQRAQIKWDYAQPEDVGGLFKWDSVSRTDALLTRHFNPETGDEQRERVVTVYLRKNQALNDLVLDIAHELTHALADPSWDPYDPALSVDQYIWAALESPGGEVDAMISECRVGFELAHQFGISLERCKRYRDVKTGDVSRDQVKRDFYRVGSWNHEVSGRLTARGAARFPLLSDETPRLYSSTGRAPYPVALIREFDELTDRACRNSKKRLESLSGRAPASLLPYQRATAEFVQHRCP